MQYLDFFQCHQEHRKYESVVRRFLCILEDFAAGMPDLWNKGIRIEQKGRTLKAYELGLSSGAERCGIVGASQCGMKMGV